MYRPLFLSKFGPETGLSLSRAGAFCRTNTCVMCKFSYTLSRADTTHLRTKYGMPTGIFHCTCCPSISGHKKSALSIVHRGSARFI